MTFNVRFVTPDVIGVGYFAPSVLTTNGCSILGILYILDFMFVKLFPFAGGVSLSLLIT